MFDKNAARLIWRGLAIKTQKLYIFILRSYKTHCQINTQLKLFSVILQFLALWVRNLIKQKISLDIIRTYVAGLQFFLINSSIDNLNVFQHLSIKKMITGLKKLEGKGKGKKRKQFPIT